MEKTWTFDEVEVAILKVAVMDHLQYLKEDKEKDDIPDEEIDHVDELLTKLSRR